MKTLGTDLEAGDIASVNDEVKAGTQDKSAVQAQAKKRLTSSQILVGGREQQKSQDRQISLHFTSAQLGGGVEGDTVAEGLGQRLIDTICRWWNNDVPLLTIIRKINGTRTPAEALSVVDVYAILFIALQNGQVVDSKYTSRNDMGIVEFSTVFKAWKSGYDKAALYRLFPKTNQHNIDKLVRAANRRVEAQLAKEREAGEAENQEELSPVESEQVTRMKTLGLDASLLSKLHGDDANAVRQGRFMVVNGRPAYVLFLGEKSNAKGKDANLPELLVKVTPSEGDSISQDIRPPELDVEQDEEAEVAEQIVAEKTAEQTKEQSEFDQPQSTTLPAEPPRRLSLAEQREQIKKMTKREPEDEGMRDINSYKFTE